MDTASVPAVLVVSLHQRLHVLDAGIGLDIVRGTKDIAAIRFDCVGDPLYLPTDVVWRAKGHRPLDRDATVEAELLAEPGFQFGQRHSGGLRLDRLEYVQPALDHIRDEVHHRAAGVMHHFDAMALDQVDVFCKARSDKRAPRVGREQRAPL